MKLLRIPVDVRGFGEAVRWCREQRRMTLRELATKVGVTAPFQSDLEHGRRETSRVSNYARELGVAVSELESRQGMTEDLAGWLKQRPDVLRLLRDIRGGRCSELILKELVRRGMA